MNFFSSPFCSHFIVLWLYLGIKALVVAIAVCGGLVAIGYSEAEKEEEEWNATLDKLNNIIAKYLKYLIRLSIMAFSVYFLHFMFHNNIATFSVTVLLAAVVIYTLFQFSQKNTKKCKDAPLRGFIDKTYEPSRKVHSVEEKRASNKPILTTILVRYLILFFCVVIGSLICNAFNFHAS